MRLPHRGSAEDNGGSPRSDEFRAWSPQGFVWPLGRIQMPPRAFGRGWPLAPAPEPPGAPPPPCSGLDLLSSDPPEAPSFPSGTQATREALVLQEHRALGVQ